VRRNQDKLIRASEVAEFVFCSRAWKLRLDGHAPLTGQMARVAGEEWHLRHGIEVRRARLLRRLALACSLLALVVLLLLILRGLQ
jgi:hypothetical protein